MSHSKAARSVDVDSLKKRLLEYAAPSQVMTDRNVGRQLAKHVECLKAVIEQRAIDFVKEADYQPLLLSYQSDATSYLAMVQCAGSFDGESVQRKGRCHTEFLVERLVLQTMSATGDVRTAIMFREPRSLRDGKVLGTRSVRKQQSCSTHDSWDSMAI